MRTIRHLLLDQVLPAALTSASRLVLHASAVRLAGRAIGFLGRAGAGKSTLAAAMTRCGASLVTDDALVVEGGSGELRAVPSYPGLRLWPGTGRLIDRSMGILPRVADYSTKERWAVPELRFRGRTAPVAALFVVGSSSRTRPFVSRPLTGRRAVVALMRYTMLLDASDAASVRDAFEMAARIAREIPVSVLSVARGRRALAAACDFLVTCMTSRNLRSPTCSRTGAAVSRQVI